MSLWTWVLKVSVFSFYVKLFYIRSKNIRFFMIWLPLITWQYDLSALILHLQASAWSVFLPLITCPALLLSHKSGVMSLHSHYMSSEQNSEMISGCRRAIKILTNRIHHFTSELNENNKCKCKPLSRNWTYTDIDSRLICYWQW